MNALIVRIALFISALIFIYFVVVVVMYSVSIFKAMMNMKTSRKVADSNIDLPSEALAPVSILVPAYNESATIIESIESLLASDYPAFEIIIVNDGSKDDTLEKVVTHFHLSPLPLTFPQTLPCQPIRRIYTDLNRHKITLVDKENGGKADSLNAAINLSRFPLICCIDADCMLETHALKHIARHFARRAETIAVGGIVRIANGCKMQRGTIVQPRVPKKMIEKIQIIEYLRAFLTNRFSKNESNNMLIISGAFGMFRKDAVVRAGGYRKGLGEDMELIVRLHHYYIEHHLPYQITMASDAVCWTQAPSSYKDLKTQRVRWHRGLITTLFNYRSMLFNPKYGKIGSIAYPQQVFIEFGGPLIEALGYLLFVLLLFYFQLTITAIHLFLMAYLCGVIQALFAVITERFAYNAYQSADNSARLIAACLVEPLYYRPLTVFWRLRACLPYRRSKATWGSIQRKQF